MSTDASRCIINRFNLFLLRHLHLKLRKKQRYCLPVGFVSRASLCALYDIQFPIN
uniref:Uncharacterized protein n=1 Tax=Anguilla anguilla TaxID=7936 RepID=A0A0E9SB18_ANGAN